MNALRTVWHLSFALLLSACGSPPAAHAPDPTPASSSATAPTPTTTTTTTAAVDAPIELRAWTTYIDFSGHGFNGSGEFYRHAAGGGWESAHCQLSHVADPEAHSGNQAPNCGAWAPVPKEKWAAIDKLRANSSEIDCARAAAKCAELGLVAEPIR